MRYIKLGLFLILVYFLFSINCYASINTYTRTEDNLLVPSDVEVTIDNMNDIINTPAVSSSEKIYDYADLLTDSQEKKLYKKVNNYVNTTNIDVAIITTKNLNGYSIDETINNFYNYNDFMDDAVVFLIYIGEEEPDIYMITSGKGEDIYQEVRIQQILENVYKDIAKSNYNKAIDDYIYFLDTIYNLDANDNYKVSKDGNVIQNIPWIEIVVLAIALTFIIDVFLIHLVGSNRNIKSSIYKKINPSTLLIKTEEDVEVVAEVSNIKEKL